MTTRALCILAAGLLIFPCGERARAQEPTDEQEKILARISHWIRDSDLGDSTRSYDQTIPEFPLDAPPVPTVTAHKTVGVPDDQRPADFRNYLGYSISVYKAATEAEAEKILAALTPQLSRREIIVWPERPLVQASRAAPVNDAAATLYSFHQYGDFNLNWIKDAQPFEKMTFLPAVVADLRMAWRRNEYVIVVTSGIGGGEPIVAGNELDRVNEKVLLDPSVVAARIQAHVSTLDADLLARCAKLDTYFGGEKKRFALTKIPTRSPAEVDALLDHLGMMLAAAAAAPAPSYGFSSLGGEDASAQLAALFSWRQAAVVAATVHDMLKQLQHEGGAAHLGLTLTPAQTRRLKAHLHWVKWLYDRNAVAWNEHAGSFFLQAPGAELEATPVPPPPIYPLNGDIRAELGDVPWPFPAGYLHNPADVATEWMLEGTAGTALNVTLLGAQVADMYYRGGYYFLFLSGAYFAGTACLNGTGDLTPLAWQLLGMSKLSWNRVPMGTAFLAGLAATEAVSGYEYQLHASSETRWLPVIKTRDLESLGAINPTDPWTYPYERIGKASMAVLLAVDVTAQARGASQSGAASRPLLPDASIPMMEGPAGCVKLMSPPLPASAAEGIVTLEVLQPTMKGWYAVVMDVLQVQREGVVRYLHPETREVLFLPGHEGYHAFKHHYEYYPFGHIREVRPIEAVVNRAKNVVESFKYTGGAMTPVQQAKVFRASDSKVIGEIAVIDAANGQVKVVDGKPVTIAAPMPGLRDLFYDHPKLKHLCAAFEETVNREDYNPADIQRTYVALVKGILEVFKDARRTSTIYNSYFKEQATAHLIQHKGHDLYITVSPEGGLRNAMLLSPTFKAGDVAVGYTLQRGPGNEPVVTTKMKDLVDTLLFDPLANAVNPVTGKPLNLPDSVLNQTKFQNETLKTLLREDALRVYALGAAGVVPNTASEKP